MRVLITGSHGNIGSEQVKAVQAAGHEIRTLDLRAKGRDEDWEHIPGDVRDIHTTRRAVEGMDAIIHLSALANDRRNMDDQVLSVNVQGTWNMLISAAEAGVKKFIYYSSVNALGTTKGFKDAEYLPIDDDYPSHPCTAYQVSKHLCEEMCEATTRRTQMSTICLRPVFVCGPDSYNWFVGLNPDMKLNKARVERWARMNRFEYWSYVDMRDVCAAGMAALNSENVGHVRCLLSAEDTVQDVPTMECVQQQFPNVPWKQVQTEYFAENPYRTVFDCRRAKEVLGWAPEYSWRNHVREQPDAATRA